MRVLLKLPIFGQPDAAGEIRLVSGDKSFLPADGVTTNAEKRAERAVFCFVMQRIQRVTEFISATKSDWHRVLHQLLLRVQG